MRKLAMEELNRADIDSFKIQKKTPITVILDNVRSLHNVGSTFRTADGFAIEKIILCGITGTPPHREIEKTALGATQSVEWQYYPDIQPLIQQLKDEQYYILAVEQATGSSLLHDFSVNQQQKYALIFGNEVHGVSEGFIEAADGCIEIPQFGTKHSLNVSVTVGIVLWQFLQKLKLS